jgi:hypothetical protein
MEVLRVMPTLPNCAKKARWTGDLRLVPQESSVDWPALRAVALIVNQ